MFTLVFWGSFDFLFFGDASIHNFFSKPIQFLFFVLCLFEKPENHNKRNGTFGYDSLNLRENFTKKKGTGFLQSMFTVNHSMKRQKLSVSRIYE